MFKCKEAEMMACGTEVEDITRFQVSGDIRSYLEWETSDRHGPGKFLNSRQGT